MWVHVLVEEGDQDVQFLVGTEQTHTLDHTHLQHPQVQESRQGVITSTIVDGQERVDIQENVQVSLLETNQVNPDQQSVAVLFGFMCVINQEAGNLSQNP